MDPMSGCAIRLVFTLPPRDSTLQYKRCVHFWNNFPCIITSVDFILWSTCLMCYALNRFLYNIYVLFVFYGLNYFFNIYFLNQIYVLFALNLFYVLYIQNMLIDLYVLNMLCVLYVQTMLYVLYVYWILEEF